MRVPTALLAFAFVLLLAPLPAQAKADDAGERVRAYLEGQAAASGPLAPNVAEAAHALGLHPARWPADDPLAGHVLVPGEGASNISLLRPLRALAFAQDPRADLAGELTLRVLSHVGPTGFGDPRTLNDDAYAILALRAAGLAGGDGRLTAMREALVAHQHDGGGWGWAVGGSPGTDLTGLALEALHWSGGIAPADTDGALGFLASTRDARGGFAESPGGGRNCESTVWGIRAQQRLGAAVDPDDWDFLLSLQRGDGGFAHVPGGASDLLCSTEAASLLGENRELATASDSIPALGAGLTVLLLATCAVAMSTRLRQP